MIINSEWKVESYTYMQKLEGNDTIAEGLLDYW